MQILLIRIPYTDCDRFFSAHLDPVEPASLCICVLARNNGNDVAAAEVEGVVVVAAEVGEGAAQLVLARPRLQAVLLDQLLDAA
jgi:hypothetical protein